MCVRRVLFFFFFKQKTAYEMRISDWSSDVCSSDLILSRYDDAPRALDRAAKDARELSQLVGETMNGLAKATKEHPLGAGIYTQEMADADARPIPYGVQKPFRDLIRDQDRSPELGRLRAEGSDEEAAALERALQLKGDTGKIGPDQYHPILPKE